MREAPSTGPGTKLSLTLGYTRHVHAVSRVRVHYGSGHHLTESSNGKYLTCSPSQPGYLFIRLLIHHTCAVLFTGITPRADRLPRGPLTTASGRLHFTCKYTTSLPRGMNLRFSALLHFFISASSIFKYLTISSCFSYPGCSSRCRARVRVPASRRVPPWDEAPSSRPRPGSSGFV